MNLLRHAEQAWVNLGAAKLRSFLALLGILVGTAAVVALISSGQLATEKALEQFKALGTDLLSVSAFSQGQDASHRASIPLSVWRSIPARVPCVAEVAPFTSTYQTMSFNGRVLTGSVLGADESLARIIHTKLARGHFVSFVDSFEHFCVIGDSIATQIREVSQDDPIGRPLRIGKTLYTIIGVLKPWSETGFFNEDINQTVIVPVAGMALVTKDSQINNAILLMKPDSPIDQVMSQVKQLVQQSAPKLTIYVRSAKQIIESMESQGRIFTLLLAVIGSISLLVGGIGIMNVMLVSVSERKKEIGIRKAVGASNQDIQALFLVESVMLSLVGGVSGVLLGLLFTWGLAWFSHWTFHVYWMPPLAGFLVSMMTGIFFGYYPARRAARLEPIVSLRSA
ncbi:ABC transporter permease [Legionella sp. CNM-4043-24]|uniref:ABC transporter permease n=1 Tax=Legionella sp. CNM-4043-24 TaxID=3421646 RepID=UPI00403AB895